MILEFAIEAAFCIIGILEFLKKLNLKHLNKRIPYLSLIFSIILGVFAAQEFKSISVWNVLIYSGTILAVTQLGYETLVKALLQIIEKTASTNKTID